MMIACVIHAAVLSAKGDPNWDMYNDVIILGLAAKALSNVLLVKNYREAASKIIMTVGLLVTLFASMSHGLSVSTLMEALPGLAIVGVGLLAKKFPRVIGVLVFAMTAVLLFFVLQKGFTLGQISTALAIGVPMILAGVCLFARDRGNFGGEEETAARPATGE